ncbi:MAG TPA: hypothetical protein VGI59_04565 [Candidatus Udaeobacter sp.]|jgi:hypothetical protein
MKTHAIAQDSSWEVSFWFAVSSPLLGVLLGFPRGGDFLSMIEEGMSITPIIFLLVILLFGFDSAGQVRTQPALKIAREISNFLGCRAPKA